MRKQSFFYFAIALILGVSTFGHATTVQRLSLEEMTEKANSIVVGNVTDSRTFWNGKVILTTYTVRVAETLKGASSRSVEFTTVGGTVGDTTLHVSGMPVFTEGENTVVFLERAGAFSTVVGLTQGKFKIDRGEVANSVNGLDFPDGRAGRPVKMPLESFKRQVRSIINNQ